MVTGRVRVGRAIGRQTHNSRQAGRGPSNPQPAPRPAGRRTNATATSKTAVVLAPCVTLSAHVHSCMGEWHVCFALSQKLCIYMGISEELKARGIKMLDEVIRALRQCKQTPGCPLLNELDAVRICGNAGAHACDEEDEVRRQGEKGCGCLATWPMGGCGGPALQACVDATQEHR